jgi:predicted MFS family arabinose efflux permease
VLRDRRILALLLAEVVSTTGAQMTWLALPWFVLVTTGSATRMTFVVAAELIGLGAMALPGGKLLRRFGAWRTMVGCDAARGALMLSIPLLHWADALSFALLLALVAVLGALTAPYFAAQKIIVPELLGEDEALVGRAAALFQGATRVTMLLGPPVGGVLIAALSAPAVLLVDAATYLVAVALVLGFVPRPTSHVAEEEAGIREGLRFLLHDRVLRVWTPVFSIGDAAWTAFFVSVPVLVVTRFDANPRIAGWLIASFGIGAVIGNVLVYRVLLDRFQGMTLISVCILGQALPLWLLTMDLPAAAYSGALVASGLANGLVNPSIHAFITLRIPPALRPSAMTTTMLVFALGQPVGVFIAGPVLDAFGVEPVLVAFATIQTLAMSVIAVTAFRARERAPVLAAELR